jgi:pyruvate,water dikinase
MAERPEGSGPPKPSVGPDAPAAGLVEAQPIDRTEDYLSRFEGEERGFQEDLLDLARASYRLRDDDNVHLDRIRRLTEAALIEAQSRVLGPAPDNALGRTTTPSGPSEEAPAEGHAPRFKVRQLVGQPAGPGIAIGRARVVFEENDLYSFVSGEILVCDSLDPTMTFVAPLASAIVERRGGMLVHGAIIAREYGLPCVTGVPDATRDIHTGDLLTVDGFLGIVVVGGAPPGSVPPEEP